MYIDNRHIMPICLCESRINSKHKIYVTNNDTIKIHCGPGDTAVYMLIRMLLIF